MKNQKIAQSYLSFPPFFPAFPSYFLAFDASAWAFFTSFFSALVTFGSLSLSFFDFFLFAYYEFEVIEVDWVEEGTAAVTGTVSTEIVEEVEWVSEKAVTYFFLSSWDLTILGVSVANISHP